MKKLTTEQRQNQLKRLAALPGDEIDTVDIPELTAEQLQRAVRRKMHKTKSRSAPPPKKAVG